MRLVPFQLGKIIMMAQNGRIKTFAPIKSWSRVIIGGGLKDKSDLHYCYPNVRVKWIHLMDSFEQLFEPAVSKRL